MPMSCPALTCAAIRLASSMASGDVPETRCTALSRPPSINMYAVDTARTVTLVPIPMDLASGKSVTVRGVRGLFVGDSTGLGSGVVWVADGVVNVVAGTLGEKELLAVADSLR